MWPLIEYDDGTCDHVKIYNEEALFAEKPRAEWQCLKCDLVGSGPNVSEIAYKYDHIKRINHERS